MACLTVLHITKYRSSSILTMVACTILQLIPFENVKKYTTVLFSDIFCSVWYTSFHYGIITYFNKRQNKFYFDDDAILELYPLKMLKNIKIFYLQMMYWDFDRLVDNSFWYIYLLQKYDIGLFAFYYSRVMSFKAVTRVSFLVRQGVWGPSSSPSGPGESPGRVPGGKAPLPMKLRLYLKLQEYFYLRKWSYICN